MPPTYRERNCISTATQTSVGQCGSGGLDGTVGLGEEVPRQRVHITGDSIYAGERGTVVEYDMMEGMYRVALDGGATLEG